MITCARNGRMEIVMAKIKCNRCDRRYSSMRLKCPYCGAHRSKNTVRKEREDISGAKYLIGALILILLIAAVAVILIMSMKGGSEAKAPETEQETEYKQDEGVNTIENETGSETEEAPEPVVEITSVKILSDGEEAADVSLRPGETAQVTYATEPEGIDATAFWTSDDESVAVVMQNGTITAVDSGTTAVNVKVGEKTASIIVKVD